MKTSPEDHAEDRVLKHIVEIMKRNILTLDLLYRYGGDEFTLLLTETPEEGHLSSVRPISRPR